MIRIPDVPSLQAQQINAPTASLAAAVAPVAALGNVAKGIASVGEHFQSVADQAQRLENARKESELRMQISTEYAKLQQDLDSDPTADRVGRTQEFFAQKQGIIDSPDLSPQVRDSLKFWHDKTAGDAVIRAGAQAFEVSQKRAILQHSNELDEMVRNNDLAGAEDVIARGVASGLIYPEQATAAKVKIREAIQLQATKEDIIHDPADWMVKNPPSKIPPGYNAVSWAKQQEFAQSQLQDRTYSVVQNIQDGMASGKITTPEQIDQLTPDLRPAAREKLKESLLERVKEGYKTKISTPEYQQATVGKVFSLLSDYTPAADTEWDGKFVEMDNLTRSLPPGAVRDELSRRIDAVRKNLTAEPKNHADMGDKLLDVAFKEGLFGEEPADGGMPTQRAINEGFLKDPEKLGKWFSPEQIAIINAPTGEKGDKEATNTSRENAFKRLWPQRATADAGDALLQSTALAIVDGRTKIETPETAESRSSTAIRSLLRYGKAKTEFAEWRKITPNASEAEVEEKIFTLAKALPRQRVAEGVFTPKPSRFADLPAPSERGNYSTGAGNVVTPDTQARVQANAKAYLKDPAADLTKAPLGMRNNNPTNIVYPSEKIARKFGAIGKSTNQDAGSTDGKGGKYSQMVFATPEDGMTAGAKLALRKYEAGMTSATELIAASNGWTPGNYQAAANIARGMGLSAGDDLNLDDPKSMAVFLKALVIQEHGPAGNLYKDSLYLKAAETAIPR